MTTPTLNTLYTSVKTDFQNKFGIPSLIGKLIFNALSLVQAGKLKILYLLSAFIYKNIFVDTADPAVLGGTLERFGLVKLGRLPSPAIAGEYKLNVTGDIAAVISAGTTWKSTDSSTNPDKLFTVDIDFTFTTTTGLLDVRALEAGTGSRLEIGDSLQVTAPIADVDSFADVDSIETTPVEAESTESYREETIQAYQIESQGGAKGDYRIWSSDAAGVREVYPYVVDGSPGEINVFVEANADDSTDGNGTPPGSMLTDVEDVIEFDPDTSKPLNERGRRPMGTFNVFVLVVTTLPVDVEIFDLTDLTLLTPIKEAIRSYLLDVRPFVAGADNPNESQKSKLFESSIFEIVRNVIGGSNSFTTLIMSVSGTPTDLYEFTDGDIPYIDNVTNSITP